ncbi:hypothetical protein J21TS7_61780 [Paenibacillus cineris]|uniref:Uncharacterized protein n=1 Tax=Paenibacillus cineris TaxID=237530 RepID=A0ABQ4LNG7_9BACL|nr:hypothetical protein J21TS7_61780 [Paenibacillus cineris]
MSDFLQRKHGVMGQGQQFSVSQSDNRQGLANGQGMRHAAMDLFGAQ